MPTRHKRTRRKRQGTKIKHVTVGEIIADIIAALGDNSSALDILNQIANFGAHFDTRDSDPSRETIIRYADAPETHCQLRFAALVLDYLDKAVAVSNSSPRQLARQKCMSVLQDPRTRQARFERPPGSDPASHNGLQHAVGAYLVVRHETATGRQLRQELLILDKQGEGDAKSYATFVGPDVIRRGTWGVSQNTLYSSAHGVREDYRRDLATLTIARDLSASHGTASIMCGILTGLSTSEFYPVAMPVLVIKLDDHRLPAGYGLIGDLNDVLLRESFGRVERSIRNLDPVTLEPINKFFGTFSMASGQNVFIPAHHVADLRGAINQPSTMIDDSVVAFLRLMAEQATLKPQLPLL